MVYNPTPTIVLNGLSALYGEFPLWFWDLVPPLFAIAILLYVISLCIDIYKKVK